jgi:hypothetical protein
LNAIRDAHRRRGDSLRARFDVFDSLPNVVDLIPKFIEIGQFVRHS